MISNNNKRSFVAILSIYRKLIQALPGIMTFVVVSYFQISIWWVLAMGSLIGIVWGEVFRLRMCRMGMKMESMMKLSPNSSLTFRAELPFI